VGRKSMISFFKPTESDQRGQVMLIAATLILCALLIKTPLIAMATGQRTRSPAEFVPYTFPKVNLGACYRPVAWPLATPEIAWGAVTGVAVDSDDHVWVCTTGTPPVLVFDDAGLPIASWGDEYLSGAHQLRLDQQGFVWVVDSQQHTVQKFSRRGERQLLIGTPHMPGCDETHFNEPTDVAIATDGSVFIADGYRNGRIVHYDSQGRFLKSWGTQGIATGELSLPHSIVIDSQDRLYVAERCNGRIQVFDREGTSLALWQNLVIPWGLSIDAQDQLWVCGSSPAAWHQQDVALGTPPQDQLLIKFDTTGRALQQWRVPKGDDGAEQFGELNSVHCIAEAQDGSLYCGDCKANRVIRLVPVGTEPLTEPLMESNR
jgi:DNA-binding beta-propeller fold protein YncE